MDAKNIPVIVTTRAALETALDLKLRIIYIDETLYMRELDEILASNGYVKSGQAGRRGVFFLSHTGDIDPDTAKIYDPYNIL